MRKATAVVTGASRGIGRAIALALHAAGHHVIAVARPSAELDALAEAGLESWAMDASTPAFFDRIAGLETLDILVNNLGTARHALLAETPPGDIDEVLRVNLGAPLHTTRAAIPALSRASLPGGGVVISITSQMGHVGASERAVYCATKFGLEGMTRALAVELAPQGIRVNAVAPTFVATPLTEATLADPAKRAWIDSQILRPDIASTADIADAVLYLVGARSVTGHSLRVDCGWTAH